MTPQSRLRKERGEKRQQEKKIHPLPKRRKIETASGTVWGEKDIAMGPAMEPAKDLSLYQDSKVVAKRSSRSKSAT